MYIFYPFENPFEALLPQITLAKLRKNFNTQFATLVYNGDGFFVPGKKEGIEEEFSSKRYEGERKSIPDMQRLEDLTVADQIYPVSSKERESKLPCKSVKREGNLKRKRCQ